MTIETLHETFYRLAALETDECVIWPRHTNNGYGRISNFQQSGLKKYVHVAALEMRVGGRPPGTDAAHGPCHNRACMNYRHLRWATRVENMADAVRDGTHRNGPDKVAKIAPSDVQAIKARALSGERLVDIAADYGISRQVVYDVRTGRRWGWVA